MVLLYSRTALWIMLGPEIASMKIVSFSLLRCVRVVRPAMQSSSTDAGCCCGCSWRLAWARTGCSSAW